MGNRDFKGNSIKTGGLSRFWPPQVRRSDRCLPTESLPYAPGLAADPVDQVTALWTIKSGPQGGLVGKRSRCLWMPEGLMLLQLDPLDHHFDPEDQVPTLWVSAN